MVGLMLVLTAWVIAWALSVPAFNPDGQVGGRVFAGWQGMAGMLAVAAYGLGRSWPPGTSVRSVAAIPLIVAILVGIGMTAALWGRG